IEDPNPVLYFEHKHLYRRIKGEVPEERYTTPIGKARTHREGNDVSVITWGAMIYTASEAADELEKDGVSVEIVDLRSVLPWDKGSVTWCPTDGDGHSGRCGHAPDGRVRVGRDDHEVAQAARRERRAGRAASGDLHGQGRHRGTQSRRRRGPADLRPGGRDG